MSKLSSEFLRCVDGFYAALAKNPKEAYKYFHEKSSSWSVIGKGVPSMEFDSFSKIKSRLTSFQPIGNVRDVGRRITFYDVSIEPKSIHHITVRADTKILWRGFADTESSDEMVVTYDQGYKIQSIKSTVRLSTPKDVVPTYPLFYFSSKILDYFIEQEKKQHSKSEKAEDLAGSSSYQE